MKPGQRQQATLRGGCGGRSSSNSKRRPPKLYIAPTPGSTVARLSKWPENVYFASDFIAEKAAPVSARRRASPHGPRASISEAYGGRHEARTQKKTVRVAPRRSSGGGNVAGAAGHGMHRRTEHTRDHGPEGRKNVASGGEAGRFLDESASALLLLHSRFFGGISQEEHIVCYLCKLCREAGWMGNLDIGRCPDLDPLVLEEMAMARLREGIPHSDEEFAFETFYRILADVAGLVYPREGRAMHRLLLEGVLPLATDTEPRLWSPRPEILYGRPALAALRMQRDTLHQLYRTYDTRARTREGTSGISRRLFLEMLSDLGVSPASVSEQRAARVFDDVMRNGLTDPGTCIRRKQQQALRRNANVHGSRDGGEPLMEIGIGEHGGRHSSRYSRGHPRGDRLCWSLFLEAMAALAVGAVRDGHPTTIRNRREAFPQTKPGNWERPSQDNFCEFPGSRDRAVQNNRRKTFSSSEDGDGFPGWLGACRLSNGFGHNPQERGEPSERGAGERMADTQDLLRKRERGARLLSPKAEHVAGKGASERNRQPTYGRGFYHDSRRSLELMPTLQESDAPQHLNGSSPVRSRQSSAQERGGDRINLFKPTFASSPNPIEEEERKKPATARHAVDNASEVPQTFEVPNTVGSEGRQTARNQLSATRTSRYKMVTSDGMTGAGGEVVDPLSETCLDGLSRGHGRLVAREAAAILDSPAAAVAQPPLLTKGLDGKEVGDRLSPAPFHGGSPPALASSLLPITSKGLERSTHRASADTGIPPADGEPLPGPEAQTAEQGGFLRPPPAQRGSGHERGITDFAADTSSDGKQYSPHFVERTTATAADMMMITTGARQDRVGSVSSRDSYNASSRRRQDWRGQKEGSRPGWSDAEESYCRHERTIDAESTPEGCSGSSKRRGGGSGLTTDTDIAMNLEAVGCTATVFEELLEPKVVAVYIRYRKELSRLFQRYSSKADGETSRCIRDDDTGAGIWRFVSDFPVLRRWGEGDSIFRLIVRASRDRGWGWQGGAEESIGHSSGLSYFGFLEVLTRMAFATDGRSPLHRKLVAFICALKMDDPGGILAS